MSDWQLQEAKNRFSEVIRRAAEEGPQTVTVRGKPAAVVVSAEAYARLVPPRKSFVEYLLSGPEWPDDMVEAVNNRSRDTGRDVDL
ncbi:MAG: type II toxin-antitoxin system Phd/YefM family antitoxin [Acetobacteraceae bacterium]